MMQEEVQQQQLLLRHLHWTALQHTGSQQARCSSQTLLACSRSSGREGDGKRQAPSRRCTGMALPMLA
jgi:hypothetical protein